MRRIREDRDVGGDCLMALAPLNGRLNCRIIAGLIAGLFARDSEECPQRPV